MTRRSKVCLAIKEKYNFLEFELSEKNDIYILKSYLDKEKISVEISIDYIGYWIIFYSPGFKFNSHNISIINDFNANEKVYYNSFIEKKGSNNGDGHRLGFKICNEKLNYGKKIKMSVLFSYFDSFLEDGHMKKVNNLISLLERV